MKSQKINHRISNNKIEKMGDYFKKSLKVIFKEYSDDYLSAYIRVHWSEIVGENIAKNILVISSLKKELVLYPKHPGWANEIKYYEEDIISKVNAFAGKNLVKNIRFATIPPDKKKKSVNLPNNNKTLKSNFRLENLNDKETEKIRNSLSKVSDEKLKEVLERYGRVSKQSQNYRRDNLIKCKICGRYNGEEVCNDCKINREHDLKIRLVKLLTDLPYYSYADAYREIPGITPDLFTKIRLEMVQRQAKKVKYSEGVTLEAKCLTMLYKSIPPEFLTDELVMETLKTLRYDLASSGKFNKFDFRKSENKKTGL